MIKKLKGLKGKVFKNKSGMINKYLCPDCGNQQIYVFIDNGEVPQSMICSTCDGEVVEQEIDQPECIWYRPRSLADLSMLACAAYDAGSKNGVPRKEAIEIILNDYIEYYNSGGLFATELIRS